MTLLDPRNGPADDLPFVSRPERVWVMASSPRTGSTLVCRTLWDQGGLGAPKEYLNPMRLRDWRARGAAGPLLQATLGRAQGPWVGLGGQLPLSDEALARHLAFVAQRRTDPSGWFGLKIHAHHHQRLLANPGRSLASVLAPVQRWVHMTRVNKEAQAVSWSRALQSGQWASTQRVLRAVRYRPGQLARLMKAIDAAERYWNRFFAEHGIEPLRITYEEAAADLGGTLARLRSFMGAPDAPLPEVPLRRQGDGRSAAWTQALQRARREGYWT